MWLKYIGLEIIDSLIIEFNSMQSKRNHKPKMAVKKNLIKFQRLLACYKYYMYFAIHMLPFLPFNCISYKSSAIHVIEGDWHTYICMYVSIDRWCIGLLLLLLFAQAYNYCRHKRVQWTLEETCMSTLSSVRKAKVQLTHGETNKYDDNCESSAA